MRTRTLFRILLLFAALHFASCNKDSEIDINQLTGTWNVYNDDPRLSVDGFVKYTFKADESCLIYSYDALSNRDTTIYRNYIVSHDNKILTLYTQNPIYKENRLYTEQYEITKLTRKEMRLECTDKSSSIKLVKSN